MKSENDTVCRTLSRDLEQFRNDIRKLSNEVSTLEASIRSQENEIDRLKIENDQLKSLAATTMLRGGLGGAAASAAARFKMTQNTIKISRLEAEIAAVKRDIDNKNFRLESWEKSERGAESMIRDLGCQF